MPGIDPNIVVHDIKTYHDEKTVQQRLYLVHPKKGVVIKVEFENFSMLVSST